MNLFRSEEHVERWRGGLEPVGRPTYGALHEAAYAGTTIPVGLLVALANAWWSDRLDPGWRPHTREQNQGILNGLGLTGEFWQLP